MSPKTLLIILIILLSIHCPGKPKRIAKHKAFTASVVKVIDGDSLVVSSKEGRVKIRLAWIDCPEYKQAYGRQARAFVGRLVYRKVVKIKGITKDRYGRLIVFVILSNGKVLNKELLKAGLAWNYIRYSQSKKYAKLERTARAKRAGLWKSNNPISPWKYRHKR